MALALVRKPGPSFIHAISQHPQKKDIDLNRGRKQHDRYVETLRQTGIKIYYLPELENQPDSVFVEDTAVIVEGKAFLCSMGEETRRGEIDSVSGALKKNLSVEVVDPTVMIDGGDVLQTENVLFIGLSKRTHASAINFFRSRIVKSVIPIPISKCLHLKEYLNN